MTHDPNFYRPANMSGVLPRALHPQDRSDLRQVVVDVLSSAGLLPREQVAADQCLLGVKTIIQQARRAAVVLSRVTLDGGKTYPHLQQASTLQQVVEQLEQEWGIK